MKTKLALSLIVVLTTVYSQRANAQQTKPPEELPKVEVGIDFSLIVSGSGQAHPGAGARLTYNLNRHFAVEGAAIFSPGTCKFCAGEVTGTITQGMVGIKAGQRFKKFGLFVKARPGVVNLSQAEFDLVPTGSSQPFLNGSGEAPFTFVTRSRTDFATDLGGVLEIYPNKKFFLRFDAGVLIERIGGRTFNSFQFDQTTGGFKPFPISIPGSTIGHFQFTSGVGFRF